MTRRTVLSIRPYFGRRIVLRIERLDERALPSATIAEPVYPMMMAGAINGSPSDAPSLRIDPNAVDSEFAGVGSILVTTKNATFLGTATAIDSTHILTAAHVLDLNNDGKFNAKDGTTGVYFVLNIGGQATEKIPVSQFDLDPDYTGFNRPAVNDDIAVLTLSEELPPSVPTYPLATSDLTAGTVITMVGYGRSGAGPTGYSTISSPVVKRVGENVVDAFYGQDDKGQPELNEVFRFDFDGPKGNGPLGGGTLGNNVETQLAPGDSGGPSFIGSPGDYLLVGVNTYVQGANAPKFGSMGGGMNVYAYLSFIRSAMSPTSSSSSGPEAAPLPNVSVPVPNSGLGPAIVPSKGGAGTRTGAKAVSDEFFADAVDAKGTNSSVASGQLSDPFGISDNNQAANVTLPIDGNLDSVSLLSDPLEQLAVAPISSSLSLLDSDSLNLDPVDGLLADDI